MEKIISIANKCKKCLYANCKKHCPIHNNIPLITKLVEQNKLKLAKDVLFQTNPFPYITSVLCNHDNQCAGNCVFKDVDFYLIEEELGKKYFDELITYSKPKLENDVLIIGGGIAGLSAAHYLLKAGIKPTIYEKDSLGGIVLNAIPDFRFNKELFKRHIEEIRLHSNVINKPFDEKTLEEVSKYSHIIVAIGSEIEVTALSGDNILKGIELLKAYNNNSLEISNKKIGVIGLGNTACDVARMLKRLNNDVSIVYRRDIESSPASKKEINSLLSDKIDIITKVSPISFDKNILTLRKNNLIEVDGKKRKQIVETDEIINLNFDLIVEALGSKVDNSLLMLLLKDSFNEYNSFFKDNKNSRSYTIFKDNYSISVIGDAYYGAWNIAEAINSANEVVNKIYPTYLFGGSFDPVTVAHIEIIDYVSKKGRLLLVPNGEKYSLKSLINFDKRVEMLSLAIDKLKFKNRISISVFEKSSIYKGSIETLRYFNHPTMVIGDDCLVKLDTWINPETLIKENNFLVITRHKKIEELQIYIKNNPLLSKYKDHFEIVNILSEDARKVSSSLFRENAKVEYVSEEILKFIKENKLYEV